MVERLWAKKRKSKVLTVGVLEGSGPLDRCSTVQTLILAQGRSHGKADLKTAAVNIYVEPFLPFLDSGMDVLHYINKIRGLIICTAMISLCLHLLCRKEVLFV